MTEWAAVLPFCNRIFKKEEINVCCRKRGGIEFSYPLAQSSLTEILGNVEAQSVRPFAASRWGGRPLEELAGYILEHLHRPLGVHLKNMDTLVKMISKAHVADAGIAVEHLEAAFQDFKRELEGHLFLEEDILYPWIGRPDAKSVKQLILALRGQHIVLAKKIKSVYFAAGRITQLAFGCEGSRAMFATLKRIETILLDQIYLEDKLLFPRVAALPPTD
jgi:iron-sulfur cluster repair protein YtfE (RIC family)